MRRFLAIGLLGVAVSGCTSTDAAMLTGGPHAGLQNMRGNGALKQGADGKQGFVWYIPADAFNGYVDASKQEGVRGEMLAGWLGNQRACPRGYVIDKRTEVTDPVHVFTYDGHCK